MERIGQHRVLSEVARGGMGAVLRALAPDGRTVAIKLLLRGREATPQQRRRLLREAEALLRLRHPQVVSLLETGEHEGAPYLVMEWVEGETLESLVLREGPLAPQRAADLVRRLALALAHCHARGLLHRDLKPGNVLLRQGRPDQPLLADFGLATDLLAGPSSLSASGTCMGTPGYWPPEQALGRRELVGPASDLYGLGALLFFALTGQPPQAATTLAEVFAVALRPPQPPGALRAGIPPALDALCVRCLAPEPGDRPPGAAALAEELAGSCAGPQPTRPRRGAPALLLTAVPIVLLGAWALGRAQRPPAGPTPGSTQPAPAASPLPAAPPPPPPSLPSPRDVEAAQALALEGRRLEQAGDLPGAQVCWERAVELDPRQAASWAGLATVRLLLEDLRGVDAAASRALELDSRLAVAWALRAEARRGQGQLAAAIEDSSRSIELDPHRVQPRVTRLVARWMGPDPPSAREDVEWVLRHDPRSAPAWMAHADLLGRDGRLAEAAAAAEQAVRLAPDQAVAWTTRALTRHRRGDSRGTAADAARALELDPRSATAWILSGQARLELGDAQGALDDAGQALALEPDGASGLGLRADARRLQGDLEGALADAERLVRAVPDDAGAWATRAEVLLARGELAGARADADQAVSVSPGWAKGLLVRARVLRALGDRAGARAALTRVRELAPEHRAWAREVDLELRALGPE